LFDYGHFQLHVTQFFSENKLKKTVVVIFINRTDKNVHICIVACCSRVEVVLKSRYNIS